MISLEALKAAGLTNARLKKIFTTKMPPGPGKRVTTQKRGSEPTDKTATIFTLESLPRDPTDWDVRCYLETMIRGEILQGQLRCANNFDKWAAMDLAYASIPIHPLVPDLMRVAMGYLTAEQCDVSMNNLSETLKKQLFERDAKGKAIAVNRPKLIEVSHNLVHSLVTRRVAALATEIYQQFPVLKYDPFSNNQTGRLVADVMTQLAEQMAGAYGYRHDYEESIRQASLYTTSVKFKAKRWHVEKQTLPISQPANGAGKTGRAPKPVMERRIVREGVLFTTPHPSRVYYDISQPLSKLNNDLGPRFIGHWDVVPIGVIKDDPYYFNQDAIAMDAEMFSLFQNNPVYFSQYYDRINYPPRYQRSVAAESLTNDRVAQIGQWAQLQREVSTVLTQHYKCVIPKDVGLGTYEDPVWIRFVMACNTTIVYAEIVGSSPASVNSYNASDGLLVSPSFGLQAIQWQQMLTNQLNELIRVQAQGLIRIWALNKKGMKKDEIDLVVNALKNPDFSELKDVVITYDAELLAQRGENINGITQKITQIRVETGQKVTEIFQTMVQTLAMAERLMFFSPQELGQISPRTVTATEMRAVKDTTLGIRDFHLIGVKQQIDADKRIIHDSYMAFGSEELEVPVAERYEPAVIEKAGFEIVDDGTGEPPDGLYTIKGKKLGLFYNFTFTTRNTDDTPPEAQVAQGIAQVYEILSKDPIISQNTTLDQRLELVNSIMTLMAPTISKLRVPPGVDGKKTQGDVVAQMQQQLQQILPQIGKSLQAIQAKQTEQDTKIAQTDAGLKALTQTLEKFTSILDKIAPGEGPSLPRGQVDVTTAPGAGAPALKGVIQPLAVPSALPVRPLGAPAV